jgi:hypothetical protein
MVSILLSLATLGQEADPLARNAAFMSSAKGLTLEFKATMVGVQSVAQAKLVLRGPNMQSFSCKWMGEEFRYIHSKAGWVALRDDLKQYDEGAPFAENRQPYGEFSGIAEFAYPNFVLAGSLKAFDVSGGRTLQGKEAVNGVSCDKVLIDNGQMMNPGAHTLWIDHDGKVVRWRRVLLTQMGTFDTTVTFTKVERTAPDSPAAYPNSLPIGYMPTSAPVLHTRTVMLGEPAVFGTWTDARRNAAVDVAKLAKGVPVTIVFTDPDCDVSKAAEPYLASLRRTLKAKGCALIEVSLGKKRPDLLRKDKDRQVFWDKDGSIERAYGIPGTPYLLLADKTGTLQRGWQGYAKSKEAEITKQLLSAFDKQG